MTARAIAGELRAWNDSGSMFIVLEIDGYRVDVILHNGKRDGVLRPYLESNSHVVSEAEMRKPKDRRPDREKPTAPNT